VGIDALTRDQVDELMATVRHWIQTHCVPTEGQAA
jgi:hypothetical protein